MQGKDGAKSGYTVFVGGFKICTSEKDLVDYFSGFGQISKAQIIRNKANNISKGYGFVSTDSAAVYEAILKAPHSLGDRKLDCMPSFHKRGSPELFDTFSRLKVFIGGITSELSDEELRSYFSQFQDMRKAYVIRDPVTLKSRKFGFVIMNSETGVREVVANAFHRIGGCEVWVKRFLKEEDYKLAVSLHGNKRSSPCLTGMSFSAAFHAIRTAPVADEKSNILHSALARAPPQEQASPSEAKSDATTQKHAVREQRDGHEVRFNICTNEHFYRRLRCFRIKVPAF